MSKSIDIDKAGACLRNILDNDRCGICDKSGKTYWRCVRGHIACDVCSIKEEECATCFTTSNSTVLNNTWVLDDLQSQKVKHALDLLNKFQVAFKTDVYRRQRISDQLKAEKELFPDCIQAPVKYVNKRKSLHLNSSIYNKENNSHPYYPGQGTGKQQTLKMHKSKYVQQWLDSSSKKSSRNPFASINVNNQILPVPNAPGYKSRTAKSNCLNKLKRSSKDSRNENKCIDLQQKYLPKTSKDHVNTENLKSIKDHIQHDNTKRIQDDSGIAMDEECVTIEDSQTENIDKDQLALQAVYEAERNEISDNSMCDNVDSQSKSSAHNFMKVPFVKKSLLYMSCPNCNIDEQNYDPVQDQYTNMISITVEYGSKVKSNVNMQSVFVQTEISGINTTSDVVTNEYEKLFSSKNTTINNKVNMESQDLFKDDMDVLNTHVQSNLLIKKDQEANYVFSQNKENVLIVDDSDTDVEAEHLQVSAEVHRSCQLKDYEILSELALSEMENRKRRAVRGVTPGSSDSSEKENCDPNRIKRFKCMKKGKKKI